MSNILKNLYEFIWAKSMTYAGKRDLKFSGEWQFCSLFYTFEIKVTM